MGAAAGRRLRRPRGAVAGGLALVAVAAVVVAVALAGGGASPGGTARAPAARDYNGTLAGRPLQRANCTSWHAAGAAQRGQAVRALTATIGGASTSGGVGRTLPDRDVTALFDRVCGTPGTSSFVLYLIYARAVAFSRQGHGPTPITAPAAQPPL
jgi:hypothetical protein